MRKLRLALMTIAVTLLLGAWGNAIALDTTVHFQNSPTLSQASRQGQRIYFTVTIPEDAGEDLAMLSLSTLVADDEGVLLVPFQLENTQAFWGTPGQRGRAIALDSVWIDETGIVWLSFAPSLQPGRVFTVALEVEPGSDREARHYGIAAYPAAENPVPAFVGDGELEF
ncbi:MAG: DUF2808 domain-containing protein [Oculatellaceae cyanobacterium Prado106]|jgi:hypothetical protein|nr:DUF2808 domain-containing protein [Oculatellaceae cyanobacterium Prado106]